MRVLHFFKTYLPDSFTGVERVIYEIAEATAGHGITSDVLSLSPKPSPVPIPVGQHLSHQSRQDAYIASTGLSLSVARDFRRLAAQADLVHYHFPWPMMDLVHLAVRPKKPSVVTYHSDVVKQQGLLRLYQPLMHRFLRSVDAVVATSPNYAASSPVLARYRSKLSVIPIGIGPSGDLDANSPLTLPPQMRSGFFLFLGAMRYYKGLPFLLEAAEKTGLPVVLAGSGDAGKVPPNVTVLGEVSEVEKQALLKTCTAFVFPSHLRSEAFGVALLEAARAGKPMISCEIGTGTSYVNEHNITGLTIPPADPQALAGAMQSLWSDSARREQMGASARARYEKLFTAKEMGDSYAALYRRLTAS